MSTGKISKVIRVKETTLPPGKYAAQWSGYRITIKLDNGEIWMTTENGVRGWVDGAVTVDETGGISWSNANVQRRSGEQPARPSVEPTHENQPSPERSL